jgi:hypothetical protein
MTAIPYIQRNPISGLMRSLFSRLPARRSAEVVRIPLVFKPDSVGLGLVGKELRRLGEMLKAQEVDFKFTAPCLFQPTRELVDRLYYEHSALDPEHGFAPQNTGDPEKDKPAEFYLKMYGPYMAGQLPDMVQMPLVSVILEVKAAPGFTTQSLCDLMRQRIVGETNSVAKLRAGAVGPEEKNKFRYEHTTALGARLTPITSEQDYNVEDYSIYNRLHCPQKAGQDGKLGEAEIQLGLIYNQEILERHFDPETARQIVGSLPRLTFEIQPLLDCIEGNPGETAATLIEKFPALGHMSHYEVELMVREFKLLAGYLLELEHDFHRSLGEEVAPLAEKMTEQALPTPYIYLLAGASGVGKSTLINALRREGLVDATLPQYTTGAASPGPDRVGISEEEALELIGQNYFLSLQSAPGAPTYFFPERALSGFVGVHGGRAVFDVSEDMVRDIQEWAKQAGVVVRTGYLSLSDEKLEARMRADQTRDRADRIPGSIATNRRLRGMCFDFDERIDASQTPAEMVAWFRHWIAKTEQPEAPAVVKQLPEREHDTPRIYMLREWLRAMTHKMITTLVGAYYQEIPVTQPAPVAIPAQPTAAVVLPGFAAKPAAAPAGLPGLPGAPKPAGLPGLPSATKPAAVPAGLPGLPGAKPATTAAKVGLPGLPSKSAAAKPAGLPGLAAPAQKLRIHSADVDDFSKTFEALEGELRLWLYEAHRYWHGTPPETTGELVSIKLAANHITQTLAAVMQGQLKRGGLLSALRRLTLFYDETYSGFSAQQKKEIAAPLIDWMSEIFKSVHHEDALMDALVHDAGKAKRLSFHERSTAELLARLRLPEYHAVFSEADGHSLQMTELVTAHHHTFGNTFLPDESLRDVRTAFEDQKVRQALTTDEADALNLPVMEKFLKRLLILGISDVAGATGAGLAGNLQATGVLTYRRNYELLLAKAREAKTYGEFMAAVDEAAQDPQETQRRFAMAPARCDRTMDAHGLDFYWAKVADAASEAIQTNKISQAEWQLALDMAPKMRRVEYFVSFPLSVMDPATGALPEGMTTKGGHTETAHIKINPNYIQYRVLLGKIAQAAEADKDAVLMIETQTPVDRNHAVSSWLNQLLETTPVSEIEVIREGDTCRLAKRSTGETIIAGTIESTATTTEFNFKLTA